MRRDVFQPGILNQYFDLVLNSLLAKWSLDPAVVEQGLAKGAELDWDQTIEKLIKS
jgi:hypothetical protein